MVRIKISGELLQKVPKLRLSCIECDVNVLGKNDTLWELMQQKSNEIASATGISEISKIPAIAASRKAYKTCGKDPARYRLSAESLLRRVVKQKNLYQVNNVVDVLNLVSVTSGYSIGGYDLDKISGDVVFGIGRTDEPYIGIGRGELNIENLPVFRDESGAFGNPTSDSLRTSVTSETKRFLMVIIDFGGGDLGQATELAKELLIKYAVAGKIDSNTVDN
jgi:DNA/RNA-binding domain of Phe-tRNA-synthetase-like protein